MHKELDTSLQRSLFAMRSSHDLRAVVVTYRSATCIRSEILAYSGLIREAIVASLTRRSHDKNKRAGVSTPVGFPLIPLQGKRSLRTAHEEG